MMMPTKIVLWGNDDLLSSYLEDVLAREKGWDVVCIPVGHDFEDIMAILDQVNPSIVIIHLGNELSFSGAPSVFLSDHPNLQVITLNLTNNLMEVYSKQEIVLGSSADLVSAIEDAETLERKPIDADPFIFNQAGQEERNNE